MFYSQNRWGFLTQKEITAIRKIISALSNEGKKFERSRRQFSLTPKNENTTINMGSHEYVIFYIILNTPILDSFINVAAL